MGIIIAFFLWTLVYKLNILNFVQAQLMASGEIGVRGVDAPIVHWSIKPVYVHVTTQSPDTMENLVQGFLWSQSHVAHTVSLTPRH